MENKYNEKTKKIIALGIFAVSVLVVFCLGFVITRTALGDMSLFAREETPPPETEAIEQTPTPAAPTPSPLPTPEPADITPDLVPVDLSELEAMLREDMAVLSETSIWGVYFENMADGAHFECYNNADSDSRLIAGELMNLYIMASVFEALELGTILDTEGLRTDLRLLMSTGSTEASDRLITELGRGETDPGIAAVNLTARKLNCRNTIMQTLVSDTGGTYTNYTTAADCASVLRSIYSLSFAGEEACREMIELLQLSEDASKIPNGLAREFDWILPEGVKISHLPARTAGQVESDVAIVFTPDTHYILSVVSNPADNDSAAGLIRTLSSHCYNWLNSAAGG